jgi:tRNA A37 threonylcarbamoyladenosine biosynthesis protein TsaE
MRLSSLRAAQLAGLDLVEVSGLSDVVVLAGPNGVGKTRLLQSLITFFQEPEARPTHTIDSRGDINL